MWKAILNNGEIVEYNGYQGKWRELKNWCKKNNRTISQMWNKEGCLPKAQSYFVLYQVWSTFNKIALTAMGVGHIINDKAYIIWYNNVTKQKIVKQVISASEIKEQFAFLHEISISGEI